LPLLTIAIVSWPPSPAGALTNCSVADTSLDGEELAFLGIINGYRSDNGLGQLTISTNLTRAATWKVNDMGTNGYFAHTDPSGRGPWELTVDCGYPIAGGENLAAGTYKDTAASAFELFRNSPTHNANMLRADYRQIGIARVYVPGSYYGWYWATEFGTTNDAAPAVDNARAPSAPPAASPAAVAPPPALPPPPSATLMTWEQPDEASETALPQTGDPFIVYGWDSGAQLWRHYAPGISAIPNDLQTLRQGEQYWTVGLTPPN
jgi:uncharacterized protein YkwD